MAEKIVLSLLGSCAFGIATKDLALGVVALVIGIVLSVLTSPRSDEGNDGGDDKGDDDGGDDKKEEEPRERSSGGNGGSGKAKMIIIVVVFLVGSLGAGVVTGKVKIPNFRRVLGNATVLNRMSKMSGQEPQGSTAENAGSGGGKASLAEALGDTKAPVPVAEKSSLG